MKWLLTLLFFILVSCSSHKLSDYKNEKPSLDLRTFFTDELLAHGIVQDRSGKVINRFEVKILASWNGDECTLDESFTYSDGTTSKRIWKLKEVSKNKFIGRAHDVVGVASGEVLGNAFFYEYHLMVPVGKSEYKIHFEDWMYLLDSKTLLARSYMTKWGFNVGEVTIVMTKKTP